MPQKARSYPVEHFVDILAEQRSPLIGGQAVNLWAVLFQGGNSKIRALRPFVSRDCDLLGDVGALIALARKTGADYKLTKAGSATPVVGFLVLKGSEGDDLLIEVLHTVKGLTPAETREGVVQVKIGGKTIHVLSPIMLLKSKIANASELSQKDRQDVRHIRILTHCVAAYLSAATEDCRNGQLSERGLVNILERCWKIISTARAKSLAAEHAIDLKLCFPQTLRRLGSPKVSGFVKHRLGSQQNC